MKDDTPDYARYSLDDLRDVERRVNRDKYPERYFLIVEEIAKREVAKTSDEDNATNSKKSQPSVVYYLLMLVLGPFLFVSTYNSEFYPLFSSRDWVKTPCVIVKSVDEVYDDRNYVLEIVYKYEYENRSYQGNRLSFYYDSGRNIYVPGKYHSKNSFTNLYPIGFKTHCFVNPKNPSESVLKRFWNEGIWFTFLMSFAIFTVDVKGVWKNLSE